MDFKQKEKYGIDDLLGIMELLRSPDGCPWDREQTHESIRRNFVEETYEAAEAIDTGDTALLREELGDVLLQVVFHSQMEKEKGAFDFGDVCDSICKKLILRHPHIFSDVKADTPGEVLKNWDAIKKEEKKQETHTEVLKGISRALPSMMRAEKLQSKASKLGFDFKDLSEALGTMRAVLGDLEDDGSADTYESVCDMLYTAVGISRILKTDPERSLGDACDRFISNFSITERLAAERRIDIETAGHDMLISLWREAQNKQ